MNVTENKLKRISSGLMSLDGQFRAKVREEFGWSEATYYRKRKNGGKFSPIEKKAMVLIARNLIGRLSETIK